MTDTSPGSNQRVALVTGSARRVGRRIAERLSEAGYRLIVHANRSIDEAQQLAEQFTAAGQPSIALAADLRDSAAVARLVEESYRQFGRIDALVNTAAIWERKPLEEVTDDDVRRHFEVNTLATFLLAQQVGLRMTAQAEGGAIVNFGDWAIARPYCDYAAYFPSKGAIPALTRSLAVELAARNPRVRVNAILPGPVMLPEEMSAEERAAVIAATLVKREGTADHAAEAVLFLLRNDFITGVSLPVDGGRSIYAPGT